MSYVPAVPLDGYAGWRFLQKTLPKQEAAHLQGAVQQREAAYFREQIGSVQSPADLVADRRLLSVALTAFGLSEDLPNRAFIRQVLESPSFDSTSFANRLADKRYVKFAKAFGFADGIFPKTQSPGFAEAILSAFQDRSFEQAVGTQNETMRVALALQRDLSAMAVEGSSDDTRWFLVLGTPNLREVFEKAFRLPSGFGALDIDRQVEILKEQTQRLTGDKEIAQFANPDRVERLIQRYFLSLQLDDIQASSGQSIALGMLQQLSDSMIAQRSRLRG